MPLGPDVVSPIDFWHAAEYLGAAARVFEVKRKAKPGQFRRWRHALKHDDVQEPGDGPHEAAGGAVEARDRR